MAKRPTLAHRAQWMALRAVVATLERLSWRRAGALGARLGALGYRPLGIRRRTVERQIAAAFPQMGDAEVRRAARGAYENHGRVAIEAALLPTLGRGQVLELFDGIDGWEHVEAALALGRGVIIVTGHLGNWELAGAYLAARGVPVDVVVRSMQNPLFDAYLNETRARLGMSVVYDRQSVRRMPRAVAEGRATAFLADQGVKHLASTYVPFFGRPAKTPRGPAVFALRYGVPVIFGVALRRPDGRYHAHVEPIPTPDTGDRDADVDRMVADYTAVLERYVRLAPDQYFWHHRRWKRQPDGTPAELRDPVKA